MVIVLITSFLLLAIIVFAIRWQRTSAKSDAEHTLPSPPRAVGLFTGEDDAREQSRLNEAEAKIKASENRAALLARAAEGEREMLLEAHRSKDKSLYDEVLDMLVEQASASDKRLLALVSYVTRHEQLRTNRKLAQALIENCRTLPDKSSTTKMLHIAALSDDAGVYQQAVELAWQFWRERRIQDLTAEELRALVDGEYWLLSASTRGSGAGFVLKHRLAEMRRELATTTRLR